MSFVGDALQSAFTPPGTNARNAQVDQQKAASKPAANLISDIAPWLKSESQFAAANEGARQANMRRLMYLSSPGNAEARQRLFENQAFANANRAATTATAANRAAGISDAYSAGQNQEIANQAQNASNQNYAQINSPEYHLQQAQQLMALYQNAMGLPALSPYEQAAQIVYGRPQVPVGSNPLGSILGTVAGDMIGGPAGGAIGSNLFGDIDYGSNGAAYVPGVPSYNFGAWSGDATGAPANGELVG